MLSWAHEPALRPGVGLVVQQLQVGVTMVLCNKCDVTCDMLCWVHEPLPLCASERIAHQPLGCPAAAAAAAAGIVHLQVLLLHARSARQ
jgi:hypothetical protein